MENMIYSVILVVFCIWIYLKFCKKPKIKTVKAPTTKSIKRKKKHSRKIKKLKRRFRFPYHGKSQMLNYDEEKYRGYIESIWDELKK